MEFKVKVTKEDIEEYIRKRFEKFDIGRTFKVEVDLKYVNHMECEVTLIETPPIQPHNYAVPHYFEGHNELCTICRNLWEHEIHLRINKENKEQ